MAKANPFRFSTKYQDEETDLLYYGYRNHNASTGGWLNRDPWAELGFRRLDRRARPSASSQQNLYRFVNNDPLSSLDSHGLDVYKIHIPAGISTGGSSVDHREIVGDDGKDGIYILSFDKDPCCGISIFGASIYGKGKVTLTRQSNISAADWIKENDATVKKTVVTPHDDVNKAMSDAANSYEKWKPTYKLGFHDCGSVANKFIEDAEKAVQRWDDRNNGDF